VLGGTVNLLRVRAYSASKVVSRMVTADLALGLSFPNEKGRTPAAVQPVWPACAGSARLRRAGTRPSHQMGRAIEGD
jgi:hypothetical protein